MPGLPLVQSAALPMSAVMEDFWRRTLTTAATFMVLSFALVFLAAALCWGGSFADAVWRKRPSRPWRRRTL